MSTRAHRTLAALAVSLAFTLAACGARTELDADDAGARASAPCSCSVCRGSCRGPAAGCPEGALCRSGVCLPACSESSPGCPSCTTVLDCDTPVQVCR